MSVSGVCLSICADISWYHEFIRTHFAARGNIRQQTISHAFIQLDHSTTVSTPLEPCQPVNHHHSLHNRNFDSKSHAVNTTRLHGQIPHAQPLDIMLLSHFGHRAVKVPDLLIAFAAFDFEVTGGSWSEPEDWCLAPRGVC